MQHPDEGRIHAWLDDALDSAEAAELAQHVAACPTCADAVAEARGLSAGASRILMALDHTPADVLPLGSPALPRSSKRGKAERWFGGNAIRVAIAASAAFALISVYRARTPGSAAPFPQVSPDQVTSPSQVPPPPIKAERAGQRASTKTPMPDVANRAADLATESSPKRVDTGSAARPRTAQSLAQAPPSPPLPPIAPVPTPAPAPVPLAIVAGDSVRLGKAVASADSFLKTMAAAATTAVPTQAIAARAVGGSAAGAGASPPVGSVASNGGAAGGRGAGGGGGGGGGRGGAGGGRTGPLARMEGWMGCYALQVNLMDRLKTSTAVDSARARIPDSFSLRADTATDRTVVFRVRTLDSIRVEKDSVPNMTWRFADGGVSIIATDGGANRAVMTIRNSSPGTYAATTDGTTVPALRIPCTRVNGGE